MITTQNHTLYVGKQWFHPNPQIQILGRGRLKQMMLRIGGNNDYGAAGIK
jgi:hypothetical protein